LDGTATAIPDSAGTPPYTYVWGTGAVTASINNLAAGTYCVTLTDANGCTATACGTVGSNTSTNCSIALTATDATCSTCTDGTASASASGGTPPYTYLWNTGVFTSTINNLAVGTYCVTVTDADTCIVADCVTVGVNSGNGGCMASFYPYVDSSQNNLVYLIENSTGNGLSYFWDFDDGNTSTQQYPTHVYSNYGIYDICLTVSDTMNCINTSCITLLLDSVPKTGTAGYTVIVVPQEPATGILEGSENDITENVLIYPNPTAGLLHIEGFEGTVLLYDSYGREVLRSRSNNLNIQKLPKGVYFIRIFGEFGKVFSQKVLKE
jgi:PKD repeat protein